MNKFLIFCASNTEMPFTYKRQVFDAAMNGALLYSAETWFTNNPKKTQGSIQEVSPELIRCEAKHYYRVMPSRSRNRSSGGQTYEEEGSVLKHKASDQERGRTIVSDIRAVSPDQYTRLQIFRTLFTT